MGAAPAAREEWLAAKQDCIAASGRHLHRQGRCRTCDLPAIRRIEEEAHAIGFGITVEQSVILFGTGRGEVERQLARDREDLLPRGSHQERLELLTQLKSNEQQEEQNENDEIRQRDG